jgi:hypothetical protein
MGPSAGRRADANADLDGIDLSGHGRVPRPSSGQGWDGSIQAPEHPIPIAPEDVIEESLRAELARALQRFSEPRPFG